MEDETRGIDLHAHTTASDGSLSPTELVQKAKDAGLGALAVTDHDTLAGLPEAIVAASRCNLELVPGVELSVEDDGGRFHLLGYLFDPDDRPLQDALVDLRRSRAARNTQIAEKMGHLGLPVTMSDVRAEAGSGEVIARPHFAQALIKKGVVGSVQEAFDRFLSTGKPLYLPKQVLTPRDAITLIHGAGGLAVMAHPGLAPLNEDALAKLIGRLAQDDGLDGIEAYYSQHSPAQTERFLTLAQRLSLIVSAGSDFHGTPKPHVPLGIIYENRPAPLSVLAAMRARLPRS